MKKYLAIDVGGTAIKYGIIEEHGTILEHSETATPKDSLENFLAVLDAVILPVSKTISGIAISMPGRIDSSNGYIHTAGALSYYMNNINLKELLTERYGLFVSIENDGKCAALAEAWLGNLKGYNSGAVIILGTGIGGGIIINQQLWRGINGSAAEFSFIPTDFINYTKHGSYWADLSSTQALVELYAKAADLPEEQLNGKVFFESLRNKDASASQVFKQYIDSLLTGILCIQSILDIEKFCIGGGISSQDILIDSLKEAIDQYFDTSESFMAMIKPKIDRCQFKNDANLIGALRNFLIQHTNDHT